MPSVELKLALALAYKDLQHERTQRAIVLKQLNEIERKLEDQESRVRSAEEKYLGAKGAVRNEAAGHD